MGGVKINRLQNKKRNINYTREIRGKWGVGLFRFFYLIPGSVK